ncbi:hypothetical protein D3C85_884020 [compost metagenome]
MCSLFSFVLISANLDDIPQTQHLYVLVCKGLMPEIQSRVGQSEKNAKHHTFPKVRKDGALVDKIALSKTSTTPTGLGGTALILSTH